MREDVEPATSTAAVRRQLAQAASKGPGLKLSMSAALFYFEEGPRAASRIAAKLLPKTQRNQTTLEVFFMNWRFPQRPRRPVSSGQAVNLKAIELQTAKEILAEIFLARPEDIEDMIQRRLEERTRREEHEWPATFSVGDDHGQEL